MTTSDTEPLERPSDVAEARGSGAEPAGAPAERERAGRAQRRGATSIAEEVVAKIAARAASEVPQVLRLGGGTAGALGGVVERFRGSEHNAAGVSAEVGQRQTAIDLSVALRWPEPIVQVADEVRHRVTEQVQRLTGLEVVEVNVDVVELVSEAPESGSGRVA